jgi:DNA gyrase/topoisomerase IV subunit A
VQADAILRMTLGQLVNLEQERLAGEHAELLKEIAEYLRILSDDANIRAIIRDDLLEIKKKFGDERRTEITGEEIGSVDLEDLITEAARVSRGPRPRTKTRSSTCSSPARTPTCSSSRISARFIGRRSMTCRSSNATAAAARL